jgi:cytochrome c556
MKIARIVAFGALAATALAVQAKPGKPADGPSPQEVIAARQASMALSAGVMGTMRAGATGAVPVKNLAFAASGLAKWGAALPGTFPASTKGLPGRAKAEIWTDAPGFAAKAKAFADATAALAAAAKADDKEAFTAALASTGAACKGCHDAYQVPAPAPTAVVKPAGN